ncbi:hypothetical protein [Algibacter aquimarinus]|uniref:DUF805 domain-containing protein n=1 Tax=Algibacter aquimarinus TaxID=1136748 RepID=A0ABP9GZ19_9FLAO
MSNDYTNPAFKKLLKKLQEESWQLELIISGFAIFGLITAYPNIQLSVQESENSEQIYKFIISLVALISCAILIFNLLLHVMLRGLWIGALGLRYVSGDIDYESLNYSKKFTKYLEKKVGSFDKYIATLENYCSIIFAISFLLIFYVLAITFTILTIAFIGNFIIDNDNLPNWLSNGVGIPLVIFIVLGMLITFIDFLTLGFLKKKKWISKIYFPIYWVFSFITLSFLYRPIVYNFLDNKFGRRLSLILVPLYVLILITTSLKYNPSNYLSTDTYSNEVIANNENYEDYLIKSNGFMRNSMIQSKVITDPYIKVFLVFSDNIEDIVFSFNPSLKPKEDKRGLETNITIGGNNQFNFGNRAESIQREYIETFNSIYYVIIDSTKYQPKFVLSKNHKNELGFETYISTNMLDEGKHLLKVNRLRISKGDTIRWNISKIPFWFYKD